MDRTDGRVWLLYLRCRPGRGTHAARPGTDDARVLARTSDDHGRSWSEPIDLTRVPERQVPVLARALSHQPFSRYRSCREFVAALGVAVAPPRRSFH